MCNILIIPVLSLFFAPVLIGYYGFAWIFYSGILLIPMAFSQVLFPKISELNGNRDFELAKAELKKVFLFYTPVVVVGVVGVLLFSEIVVGLIAPAYLPGLVVFKVLNVSGLILGYLWIYRTYLSAISNMKKYTLWVIIQNISLFIISFIIMMY